MPVSLISNLKRSLSGEAKLNLHTEAICRLLHGSSRHVRFCAEPDLLWRLEQGGFRVSVEICGDAGEIQRYGLNPGDQIYCCENHRTEGKGWAEWCK